MHHLARIISIGITYQNKQQTLIRESSSKLIYCLSLQYSLERIELRFNFTSILLNEYPPVQIEIFQDRIAIKSNESGISAFFQL